MLSQTEQVVSRVILLLVNIYPVGCFTVNRDYQLAVGDINCLASMSRGFQRQVFSSSVFVRSISFYQAGK